MTAAPRRPMPSDILSALIADTALLALSARLLARDVRQRYRVGSNDAQRIVAIAKRKAGVWPR